MDYKTVTSCHKKKQQQYLDTLFKKEQVTQCLLQYY